MSNDAGHYVVIGLGHIGSRVVSLLHKLGRRVVVITDSTKELWLRAARDAGAQVILGGVLAGALFLAGCASSGDSGSAGSSSSQPSHQHHH